MVQKVNTSSQKLFYNLLPDHKNSIFFFEKFFCFKVFLDSLILVFLALHNYKLLKTYLDFNNSGFVINIFWLKFKTKLSLNSYEFLSRHHKIRFDSFYLPHSIIKAKNNLLRRKPLVFVRYFNDFNFFKSYFAFPHNWKKKKKKFLKNFFFWKKRGVTIKKKILKNFLNKQNFFIKKKKLTLRFPKFNRKIFWKKETRYIFFSKILLKIRKARRSRFLLKKKKLKKPVKKKKLKWLFLKKHIKSLRFFLYLKKNLKLYANFFFISLLIGPPLKNRNQSNKHLKSFYFTNSFSTLNLRKSLIYNSKEAINFDNKRLNVFFLVNQGSSFKKILCLFLYFKNLCLNFFKKEITLLFYNAEYLLNAFNKLDMRACHLILKKNFYSFNSLKQVRSNFRFIFNFNLITLYVCSLKFKSFSLLLAFLSKEIGYFKKQWRTIKIFKSFIRNSKIASLHFLGLHFLISGTVQGRLRTTRFHIFKFLNISLGNLNSEIFFLQKQSISKYGALGLKLWVFY